MSPPFVPISYNRPPHAERVSVQADLLGISRPSVYKARTERRLFLTTDLVIYTPLPQGKPIGDGATFPHCQRCQGDGERHPCHALCRTCRAQGWRWCSADQHVVSVAEQISGESRCYACRSRHRADPVHARLIDMTQPPPGFIRLTVVAARMGYDRRTLQKHIAAGWMAGAIWQERRAGGMWLPDLPTYPAWPDKRRGRVIRNKRTHTSDHAHDQDRMAAGLSAAPTGR